MMSQTPLLKFIALITFDRDYEKIGARIASLEQDILLLKKREQEELGALATAEHTLHLLKKEIDAYERAVKELDGQIKEKKERIAMAMSPRESRAIQLEIDGISAQQLQVEEQLLMAWNSFETRKRAHEKLVQSMHQQAAEIQAAITQKQDQMTTEKALLVQGLAERKAFEQGVPAEWLEKYAAMRCRVANPVVPVEQDSCSACFHSMSEQELVQLRRRALLQCKGCYRFLYMPAVHQMG